MASAYEVGTRAWQPDTAEGWVASELVNKTVDGSKVKLTFQLENGEVSHPYLLLVVPLVSGIRNNHTHRITLPVQSYRGVCRRPCDR